MTSECKHGSATKFCDHCINDIQCNYYGFCIQKGELISKDSDEKELINGLFQIRDELIKKQNTIGAKIIRKAISELREKYGI